MTSLDGKIYTEKNFAAAQKAQVTPTLMLFDESGKETIRWESSFCVFHTAGMLTYTASGDYQKEPCFQRYLSAKAEHIRESGRGVNIWRYADEPLAAK